MDDKPWNYLDWNKALADYFFPLDGSKAAQRVYLTVDDTVLHEIRKAQTRELSRDDFLKAAVFTSVSPSARSRGWDKSGLCQGVPLALGLLCLQVYAVYQMDYSDEGYTPNAYWPRLKGLLGDNSSRELPVGLDRDNHQNLWRSLEKWLRDRLSSSRGYINLPERAGSFAHIRLPFSQALLRKADLDDLSRDLFSLKDVQPGEQLSAPTVTGLLRDSLENTSKFCQRVFADDDRCLAAWSQVADHIEFHWIPDQALERTGRKQARLETTKNRFRRLIVLWRKHPRPPEFQTCKFATGKIQDRIDVNRAELRMLLGNPNFCGHDGYRLLVRTDGEYREERTFGPGQQLALFLRAEQVGCFENTLTLVCEKGTWDVATFPEQIPKDWTLVRFQCRSQFDSVDLGEPWAKLLDKTKLKPSLQGGLRLPRKVKGKPGKPITSAPPTWMVGFPPTVEPSQPFLVNQRPSENCDLPKLQAGRHRVWFQNHERFAVDFELAEPSVASPIQPLSWNVTETGWPQLSENTDGSFIGMECHLESTLAQPKSDSLTTVEVLLQRLLAAQAYPRRELSGLSLDDCKRLKEIGLGAALLARLGWTV